MSGWDLVVAGAAVLIYALASGRIERSILTPAIFFVAMGLLVGEYGLGLLESSASDVDVRLFAEVTLALVLFADASTLDTRKLWRETNTPLRLLGIGLPLTILLGTAVAIPLFSSLGVFEAVVLAVLLAPTDAALGQTVVSDTRLPSRLRQGLSVESGLNDGICVPLLFAAIAAAELTEAPSFDGEIVVDLLEEVGIALGIGVGVGVVIALLLRESTRREWAQDHWVQVVPLATVGIAYVATDELGGSGFIATFAAGLAYGRLLGKQGHRTILLSEELGGVLSAVTFLLFGAVFVGPVFADLDGASVGYAVLSLTVVRMLPVALSFVGSRAEPPTMAFAGWFGPRGLASIVFVLTVVEETDLPGTATINDAVTITVVFSVIAHGLSARPLTDRYLRWFETSPERLAAEPDEPVVAGRHDWHRRSGVRSPLSTPTERSDP